jgi:hypothetical protein
VRLKFIVLPLALAAAAALGACQPQTETAPTDPAAAPEAGTTTESPGAMESPMEPTDPAAAPAEPGAEAPPGG